MIKPDWKIFKAKFSENPQDNFEWLCYLLVCKQFHRELGIFRYKNQSGIETDPIYSNGEVIGWQAKFYETTLSSNKKVLIEALANSKRDYEDLTKMIFYTNQEWGQSNIEGQNDPKAKIEIEEEAKKLNIQVEWKTASFFESPFVVEINKQIAQHFFSLEKSIIQLLSEKQSHTESVLDDIQTFITFQGEEIEIKRNDLLKKIVNEIEKEQVLMVTGTGGVGKTALIKRLYEKYKTKDPFYIIKASEFEINNVDNLFSGYSFLDFLDAHKEEKKKIIVIDSAEKLLDLENKDPFKEFISVLINNEWKIIFTARSNYLSDLDMQFIDQYKVKLTKFYIETLSEKELMDFSQTNNFNLPIDTKLLELISSPFYLNEYLKFYNNDEVIDYQNFKDKLWDKIIKKSKPIRELCFINLAFQRVSEGQFFIVPNSNESTINLLEQEGILGYETAGYFITHDIYEEWALEKKIESEFIRRENCQDFFNKIGESLPIRRSFRKWVSDKLATENISIENFIEEAIEDESIPYFWKDEVLISVLLSNYSDTFIELFEEKLLEDNQKLLIRVMFLLRLACKEVDENSLKRIGVKNRSISTMQYIFTKPKGNGWGSVIKLLYKHKNSFGLEKINYILPIINEWNSKFYYGETTRLSSLIALKYFDDIIKEDSYRFQKENTEKKLLETILNGASEIKQELSSIFDEIIKNEWRNYGDPYYALANIILSKIDAPQEVFKLFPNHILKLADMYWFNTQEKRSPFDYREDVDKFFGIGKNRGNYFPPSAFQTPIYWLLHYSFKETIDFLLKFIGKTVECYAKSELDKSEIKEVDIVSDSNVVKQYSSQRLWNTYRGTHLSPYVVQSIHMALEKYLLKIAQDIDTDKLKCILLYLINNSNSSSVTAVVASIVLAQPQKTFEVAKILFQTKDFFLHDNSRMVSDQTDKSLFSLGTGGLSKIHVEERVKSFDDKHRENSLERLALSYQLFRDETVTDEKAEERQRVIWEIFDKYYEEIREDNSKKEDSSWRLSLARMDRRKMEPTFEKVDEGLIIKLNPEIEPKLKECSEAALQDSSESMKYISLKLWAGYKIEGDEKYNEYTQYEENPEQALKEVKEILKNLKKKEANFNLFNYAIPAHVCTVLIRDYFEDLSNSEKEFCKDIVLSFASASFKPNYTYQINDGTEAAISILPFILGKFPAEKAYTKSILLLTLFDSHSIGAYANFSDYSANTILKNLWSANFVEAQSLLIGFLYLKPVYEAMRKDLWKEKQMHGYYEISENELIANFREKYEEDIENVLKNSITLSDIKDITNMDLRILRTAFQLIPLGSMDESHNTISQNITITFAERLLSDEGYEKVDYQVSHDFLRKFTRVVLTLPEDSISTYISPFINNFNNNESIAELFKEFIFTENVLKTYDKFWLVWNLFYDAVAKSSKNEDHNYINQKIIKSYLFAEISWSNNTPDWHTLKDNNKRFLGKVVRDMGESPAVLYSIVKLLNGIGKRYVNDGIFWISKILTENKNILFDKLESDTIYFLENLMRNYIYNNREKIKRETKTKREILVILDFLVEKGSVAGYMLRENIL